MTAKAKLELPTRLAPVAHYAVQSCVTGLFIGNSIGCYTAYPSVAARFANTKDIADYFTVLEYDPAEYIVVTVETIFRHDRHATKLVGGAEHLIG